MGVSAVISGADDDITRSGAVDPTAAADELAGQGLSTPSRSYGPVTRLPAQRGDIGTGRDLPQVRRYDTPTGRGLVDVVPSGPDTIVDGSAQGLADMAAFGALPDRTPIFYAADLSDSELRRRATRGANVVVTDSNRRRAFVPTHTQQNQGRVLEATEPLDSNSAIIEPFKDRGSAAQTVSVLHGAKYLRAPEGGGPLPFPERSAIHAFDGDPETLWAAARYLLPGTRWLEVGFDKPRDVPYVDLLPVHDWRGIEREVDINGVRAELGPGVTRVPVRLHDVTRVRIRLTRVDQPDSDLRGSGGFREIRIPGVRLSQTLRAPVTAARALAGEDLHRVGLTYLFERNTGDRPRRRDRYTGSPLLEQIANRQDVEKQIDRTVFAPEARSYEVDAWVQPAVDAPDSVLDRLAGVDSPYTFESSSRFQNQGRSRASSAFDERADTAWIGVWEPPSAPHPWISWTGPRAVTVSRLTLTPAELPIRRPTLVRLSWSGGSTAPLRVGADGTVRLRRPVRARSFRLTVLGARFPAHATSRERQTRAVGIASMAGTGVPPVGPPLDGALQAPCGSVRIDVGGRRVSLRPQGSVADLNAGRPLRARSCEAEVQMGRDVQRIRSLPGSFSVDLMRMRSPAPALLPPVTGGGAVEDAGRLSNSSLDGVRVALKGPSWLVLGQSYSNGWEATCDGRSLGPPQPINAFANGWRAPSDCRNVDFTYRPQATAVAGYVISGLGCAVLLAFLCVGLVLARRADRASEPRLLPDAPPRPMPVLRAGVVALVVSIPLSLLFAKRTGVVVFPLLTVILWRGVGPRILTGVAAVLLGVVVPIMYLLISPKNQGGFNFDYSQQLINAHWVGVLAVILLGTACWQMLARARARARNGEPPPGDRSSDRGPEPDRELAGARS
jgi:arabinofuranan 3-O-arabinosyltransferase